ncbi:MAG: hypothetical protein K6F17_07455 [Lachnospiraceae bacterium]|nr:hypothetical protein [Lachnospiraceae bacterium]
MAYVYIYRLTSDTGFAPCVEGNLLTLACCKGGQMRGDKVINTGLRYRIGAQKDVKWDEEDVYIVGTYKDKFLYLARVTKVITMEEYYSGLSKGRMDDIYSFKKGELVRNNKLRDKINHNHGVHTESDRVIKDLAGKYVIMSNDYIYLGEDAVYDDVIVKYNPKFQETKKYAGEEADIIINACKKHKTKDIHIPNEPYKKKGCCR